MNRYFYIDAEGKQKGTFSPDELRSENLKRETLVWTQGMEQWKRAEEVQELQYLFSAMPAQNVAPSAAPQPAPYIGSQSYRASEPIQPMPKTWMIESILATVLPFMFCGSLLSLLGIIGIVNAAQVESAYNRGDYVAAAEASRSAGRWTKVAFWIAIGWLLLIVIGVILAIVFAGSLIGMSDVFGA